MPQGLHLMRIKHSVPVRSKCRVAKALSARVASSVPKTRQLISSSAVPTMLRCHAPQDPPDLSSGMSPKTTWLASPTAPAGVPYARRYSAGDRPRTRRDSDTSATVSRAKAVTPMASPAHCPRTPNARIDAPHTSHDTNSIIGASSRTAGSSPHRGAIARTRTVPSAKPAAKTSAK